jgi:hypothetical protein
MFKEALHGLTIAAFRSHQAVDSPPHFVGYGDFNLAGTTKWGRQRISRSARAAPRIRPVDDRAWHADRAAARAALDAISSHQIQAQLNSSGSPCLSFVGIDS